MSMVVIVVAHGVVVDICGTVAVVGGTVVVVVSISIYIQLVVQ